MKRFISGSLHYTRRERLGTIVLTFICIAVFALPEITQYFFPRETTDFTRFQSEVEAFRAAQNSAAVETMTPVGESFEFDPNTAGIDDFVRLGLSERVARTIDNYRNKGGVFRKPEDFRKIWSLTAEDFERLLPYIRIESAEKEVFAPKQVARQYELFAFDPNAATEGDFLRLGLPAWTVRSILNYRTKGGAFRKKEDFRKIYNLKAEDYNRLEPYIVFGQIAPAAEVPRPASFSGGAGYPKSAGREMLDINSATAEDWQRLPGIGEKRASQIVKYRSSLGGFVALEQVAELYGLPDSVFQRIRPFLALQTADIQKIDLNTASADDLDRHPYISGKQARLIVAYREQHGAFASPDKLSNIAAFTDKKWLEKVKPYLVAK